MGSNIGSLQSGIKEELATSPRLYGISRKIAILVWGLVTLTSLLSLSFSVYRLNLWDRTPATETIRYFPDMIPEGIQAYADWQNTILEEAYHYQDTLPYLQWHVSWAACNYLWLRSCSSATIVTI